MAIDKLFCDSEDEYDAHTGGGLFPYVIDAKSFLEEYFKIDLTLNT